MGGADHTDREALANGPATATTAATAATAADDDDAAACTVGADSADSDQADRGAATGAGATDSTATNSPGSHAGAGDAVATPRTEPTFGPPPDPAAATVDGGRDARATVASGGVPPEAVALRAVPTIPGYEILGELGRGGMGVVYRARQVRLNRPCALKMILAGAHATPEAAARFLAEAEAVAKLQHPHIVQIFHVDEHAGFPYFEMEYVGGGSLAARLDGAPRPPRDAARLVETLAGAMAEVHRRGVVHRDLKPANILLTPEGTPKVADFGLAKLVDVESGLTRTDSVLGSPSYMAPEQAEGKNKGIGPAADVYALGAILYELLVGRPPFRGATVLETLQQVKTAEPVPPSRLVPGLPRDAETIALKCLQKDPGRRYESAAALAEDLRRYQAGEPIVARPVGPAERAWRWCRRNPVIASLTAAVATLLVIVAVVSSAMALRERRGKDELEETLYFNRIALAAREMEARNVGRAEELLAECPPRLRGWEWHYLRRVPRDRPLILRGHTGRIAGIAYSPGGERLASISLDLEKRGDNGEVRVWDTTSGREQWTARINASGVQRGLRVAPAFSPDGRRLAAPDLDRGAGRSCHIKVWDSATGGERLVLRGHADLVIGLAFSTDGERMVSADSAGWVRLWDASAGREIGAFRSDVGPLWSLAYHPDGGRVALGGEDGTVSLWDVTKGQRLLDLRGSGPRPYSLAFDLHGTLLAVGSARGVVKVWDTASGQEPFALPKHPGTMFGVAFVPHASYLATSSGDGTFRLWDLRCQKEALSFHTAGNLWGIAFSPDGRRLAMALGDSTIQVISAAPIEDATLGRLFEVPHTGPILAAGYSPDGMRLATVEAGEGPGHPVRIRVMDAADGRRLNDFSLIGSPVTAVAFGPDGQRFAAVDADGSVMLRDVANGRALHMLGKAKATILAYSPDGRWIASNDEGIGRDTKLVIWDAGTGREVHSLDAGASSLNGLAFSPDGRRVAAVGADVFLRVWDAETGERLRCAPTRLTWVGPLAYNPDGRQIATGGTGEAGLRTWDTATGRLISDLPGHPGHLMCVAYSPDGRLLASGSTDKTVRIWELATAREIRTLVGHSDWVTGLTFSPDGRRLASSSYDRTVKIWDVTGLSGLR